jgi:hypothetical protein
MYLYHYVFFTLLILYSVPLFFFYLHRVYMDYISTPLQSGTTTFDITVAPELRDVSCRKTYKCIIIIDEDKLELYIASIFMITCESIRVARQLKNTKLEIIHKCCLHRYTVYKKKSITQ